jgi:beta-lactamase superfamily II metal-dependent hydrolase
LREREGTKVRGAVFLLFLFFSIAKGQIIEIHQLNVDQGDACFIRADTFKILIDGGNATKGNNIINPYLTALGISKLNFTVASHHHADHIGGLDEVILRFNPDTCYDRGDPTQVINSPNT